MRSELSDIWVVTRVPRIVGYIVPLGKRLCCPSCVRWTDLRRLRQYRMHAAQFVARLTRVYYTIQLRYAHTNP